MEEREAAREHAISRYKAALDAGDMQGVGQVLHEAQEDPDLDRLITAANREAQLEIDQEMYEEEARSYREARGALPSVEEPDRLSPEEAIRSLRVAPPHPPIYDPEDLIW